MTDRDDRWAAVAEAVRARRDALGLTQVELARVSGVSEPTIRALERKNGPRRRYRPNKLRAIARALRWPDDAISRIRAGQPPDEPLAAMSEERIAALEAELERLRDELGHRQRAS